MPTNAPSRASRHHQKRAPLRRASETVDRIIVGKLIGLLLIAIVAERRFRYQQLVPDDQSWLEWCRHVRISRQHAQGESLPSAGATLDLAGEQVPSRRHLARMLKLQHLRVFDLPGAIDR